MLVDSGNALFRVPSITDPAAKDRAGFIVDVMGELQTAAMAAGARDLVAGADFLKARAGEAGVKVLSANLVDAAGKALFSPSVTVTAGDLKVGLIGLSPAGVAGAGAPVKAALAEAARLRPKVDVVVVLAAVPRADAIQLATEAHGTIDFILQSHEAGGAGVAQAYDTTYLMPSGERGRQLRRLHLTVGGKGAFADLSAAERAQQNAALLAQQIVDVKHRIEVEKEPSMKKALQGTLASFEQRRQELVALQAQGKNPPRSFDLTDLNLGAEVVGDPALKARVERLEPPH